MKLTLSHALLRDPRLPLLHRASCPLGAAVVTAFFFCTPALWAAGPGTGPSWLLRRYRVPHALHSIGFSGGPRRHWGDSVALQCMQGPPNLLLLENTGVVVAALSALTAVRLDALPERPCTAGASVTDSLDARVGAAWALCRASLAWAVVAMETREAPEGVSRPQSTEGTGWQLSWRDEGLLGTSSGSSSVDWWMSRGNVMRQHTEQRVVVFPDQDLAAFRIRLELKEQLAVAKVLVHRGTLWVADEWAQQIVKSPCVQSSVHTPPTRNQSAHLWRPSSSHRPAAACG